MLRREQAPALRCYPIIPQIGRENNISAEIYGSRTVEDADPYSFVNILMRTSLKFGFSLFQLFSRHHIIDVYLISRCAVKAVKPRISVA